MISNPSSDEGSLVLGFSIALFIIGFIRLMDVVISTLLDDEIPISYIFNTIGYME